jgi:hypothetical protein
MRFAMWRFPAICLLGFGLAGGGCQSSGHGTSPFAAVEIRGKTPDVIRQVTRQVFEEHGYTGTWGVMSMVFDRPASTLNNLVYGDWDLNSVSVRVEVNFAELGTDGYRVSCEAYRVRNAGDRVFQDSQKLNKISKGPYQKMLNQVKQRVDAMR